jgi:hypothetical protein
MSIVKKPALSEAKENAFINQAPDGIKPRRVHKGNKVQISLTIKEDTLTQVDSMAGRLGISRAALVSMALGQILEKGLNID